MESDMKITALVTIEDCQEVILNFSRNEERINDILKNVSESKQSGFYAGLSFAASILQTDCRKLYGLIIPIDYSKWKKGEDDGATEENNSDGQGNH